MVGKGAHMQHITFPASAGFIAFWSTAAYSMDKAVSLKKAGKLSQN